MSFLKKMLRYFLPLGLIIVAVIVVIGMATMAKGKRPERQDDGQTAVLVESHSRADARSLNFIVQSQGTVRPRTQTTARSAGLRHRRVRVRRLCSPAAFFAPEKCCSRSIPSDYQTALKKRAEATLASRKAKLAPRRKSQLRTGSERLAQPGPGQATRPAW